MMKNTVQTYGAVSKVFHWAIAIVIISAIVIGIWINTLDPEVPGDPQIWLKLVPLHKSIGITAFVLAVLRIAWVFSHVRPKVLPGMTPFMEKMAKHGHYLLYVLTVIVPLTGYLASASVGAKTRFFDLFLVPNLIGKNEALDAVFYWGHFVLGYLITAVVLGHMLAAIWHHVSLKDNTLRRMLPFAKLHE